MHSYFWALPSPFNRNHRALLRFAIYQEWLVPHETHIVGWGDPGFKTLGDN
jgi:hypothetical protein